MPKRLVTVIEPFGYYTEVYTVASGSIEKVMYAVGKLDTGQWTCSCPAWIFANPKKNCKHIRLLQLWLKSNPEAVTINVSIKVVTRFSAMDV